MLYKGIALADKDNIPGAIGLLNMQLRDIDRTEVDRSVGVTVSSELANQFLGTTYMSRNAERHWHSQSYTGPVHVQLVCTPASDNI